MNKFLPNVYCEIVKKQVLLKNKNQNNGYYTPLSKIPVLLKILFQKYKMNEIVSKFLSAEDKFMPDMHLGQPGFTYSTCGQFTKNKTRIQKLKKQEIQDIFIKTNTIKSTFNIIWLIETLKFI